jgi:GT2 family glycosyltransferase
MKQLFKGFLMKNPKISIVIATKDRPDQLSEFLSSIQRAGDKYYELIVVDSSDDEEIRTRNRRAVEDVKGKYIYEERRGISLARNTGVEKSSSDIVVFADDDFIVRKGWIRNLIRNYEDPEVACCTGNMLSFRNDATSRLFERSMSFDRGNRKRVFSKEDINIIRLLDTIPLVGNIRLFEKTPVPWSIGHGFCSFRIEIFQKVGFFNTSLGAGSPSLGGEEIDMFYRILKKGFKIVYEPEAVIYHDHRHAIKGILQAAYSAGSSTKAFTKTHFLRGDLYALACFFGAFFLLVFGVIKASQNKDFELREMILNELKGLIK